LSPLRNRDFRLLFAGTLVSHTGDIVQSMAQSWLVFQLTHSALKLGVIGFCQLLPRLILGAIGGVFVDRFDRRRLLIVTQAVAMAQSIILWALVATNTVTYGEIVVLTVVLGIADTLHLTARHSMIPALVPPSELQAGVALNAAGFNVTQVIGPSLGGLLLGVVGVAGCLAINAVSFVAILLALFAMRLPARVPPVRTSVVGELVEGFRFVGARERLWVPIALSYGLSALGMAFHRLLPIFASDVLHGGARSFGALLAAPGLGALVASLMVAARGKRPGPLSGLYRAVLVLVGALVVFALSRWMGLSLLALAIIGAAQMLFRTVAMATLHEATDDAHRGRVVSIFLLDYGLWSFGTLWLGWLAEHLGPTTAVLCGAGACLAVTGSVYWLAGIRRSQAQHPRPAG
jgi:MFS family permease